MTNTKNRLLKCIIECRTFCKIYGHNALEIFCCHCHLQTLFMAFLQNACSVTLIPACYCCLDT